MIVAVNVHLKKGVLDPQGKAVHHALETLGFKEIKGVRVGKQILLEIDTDDKQKAVEIAKKTASELLANPVIENFELEVKE